MAIIRVAILVLMKFILCERVALWLQRDATAAVTLVETLDTSFSVAASRAALAIKGLSRLRQLATEYELQ